MHLKCICLLYKKGKNKLDIIIYFFMFVLGIVLGSFYTLAVYRIPLKQDITHTRSYCPKCNHRLNFWDLIPVLSYIFLGGKCRYCKEKIRPRYLIIELLSGIIFLLFACLLDLNLLKIEYEKIGTLIFGIMLFSTAFIVIGIFKEYKKVQKNVLNFGVVTGLIYMIYLYILNRSIYRYIIYILLLSVIALINNLNKTKEKTKIIAFLMYVIIGIFEIFMVLS